MKKLLFSFIVLGITSVLAIAATSASFSDTVVVEDNQFTAGTLQLDVQNKPEAIDRFVFANIKPGDTGGWDGVSWDTFAERLEWDITNTGTIDGTLTVSVVDIIDEYWDQANVPLINGIPQYLSPATAGDPRLSSQIRPQVRVNGVWRTESSGFHNLNPFTVDLAAGETVNIRIAWSFYSNAGNEYQGASSTMDFKFNLEQN